MITDPGFTSQHAIDEICNGVIEAVADRPGESDAVRIIRQQTVGHTIRSFEPRNPLEAMLAGHCVIFDELLRDTVRDAMQPQPIATGLRVRSQVHGCGRMFLANLKAFLAMHDREAEPIALQPADATSAPRADASTALKSDQASAEPSALVGDSAALEEIPGHRQSEMPAAQAVAAGPQPLPGRPATDVTRTATPESSAHPGVPATTSIQETGEPAKGLSVTPPDLPEVAAIALPEPEAEPSACTLPENPSRLPGAAGIPSALPVAPQSGADQADNARQLEQLFRLAQAALAEDSA